ncbi:hypothetical protein ACOMHN_044955 [Nucella lapillus]
MDPPHTTTTTTTTTQDSASLFSNPPPPAADDVYTTTQPQTSVASSSSSSSSAGHLWHRPGDASSFQGAQPVHGFSDFDSALLGSLPAPSQFDGAETSVANFLSPTLPHADSGQAYSAENGTQYLSEPYQAYSHQPNPLDHLGYMSGLSSRPDSVSPYGDLNAAADSSYPSYHPLSQNQHHQHQHQPPPYMPHQQQHHIHHHHHHHQQQQQQQQPYQYYYSQHRQQQQQQQQEHQELQLHQHQHQQQQQQQQQPSPQDQDGTGYYYGTYLGSTLPPFDWRYVECFGKIYPWERRSPAYGLRGYANTSWADSYSPQLMAPRHGPHIELVNFDMWRKFYPHTCEMIITKCGRRMFPTLNVRLVGLDPKKLYNVYVDMALADTSHLKYSSGRWQPSGQADTTASVKPPAGKMPTKGIENSQSLRVSSEGFLRGLGLRDCRYGRVFVHPESPNTGAFWMKGEVAFSKLKLTNNRSDKNGHVIISSMHKYQPRVHVMAVKEGGMGVEEVAVSAVYAETQFIAVTAYQNTDITTLKIDNNPFAKGFREPNGQRQMDNMLMKPPGPLNVVVSSTPIPSPGDSHLPHPHPHHHHSMVSTTLNHYHPSPAHPHTAQPGPVMHYSSSGAHNNGGRWEGNNGNAGGLYSQEVASVASLGAGYHSFA